MTAADETPDESFVLNESGIFANALQNREGGMRKQKIQNKVLWGFSRLPRAVRFVLVWTSSGACDGIDAGCVLGGGFCHFLPLDKSRPDDRRLARQSDGRLVRKVTRFSFASDASSGFSFRLIDF